MIKIWNLESRAQIKKFKGHCDTIKSVTFSPDGKTLASGSVDKTIKIWNLKNGKRVKELKGHSDTVYSVVYSPDGKTLASGS